MDPIVDVFTASFEACREYVQDKVGWFSVSLFKEGNIIKTICYDRGSLELNVKEYGDFDKIKIESRYGSDMEKSGHTLEMILKKVASLQNYNSLDVQLRTAGTPPCELFCFEIDENITITLDSNVHTVVLEVATYSMEPKAREGEMWRRCRSIGGRAAGESLQSSGWSPPLRM